ncbi:unnamed protein product [Moneuplotes crassus]|uniref:Uncharacterized protein n=1 Tax=Euplotes crassus TaxID=5936 RepID=A0AAD1Y7Q3_EUPCR|nr:unnamed protein product [Moneuplotes crassus]
MYSIRRISRCYTAAKSVAGLPQGHKRPFVSSFKATTALAGYQKPMRSISIGGIGKSKPLTLFSQVSHRQFSSSEENKDGFGIFGKNPEEEEDRKEAINKISLKLAQTKSSQEVLNIFQTDYIKAQKNQIYVEELILMLHFIVRHMGEVTGDTRLNILLNVMFAHFENVSYEYCATTISCLGFLVNLKGLGIELEMKKKVLNEILGRETPKELIPTIPTLVFSLSTFFHPHEIDGDVQKAVKDCVETYIIEGVEMMEPAHAATLLTAIVKTNSRGNPHDQEVVDTIMTQLERPKFFDDAHENELINILVPIVELGKPSEKLLDSIHECIMAKLDRIDGYNTCMLAQAYARIGSQNNKYFKDIAPHLLSVYRTQGNIFDSILYENQWLTIATFKEKGNDTISDLTNALMDVMDNQHDFSFSDLHGYEATNILVGVASLEVKNVNFIRNIVSVITHHLKSIPTSYLINTARTSFYCLQFTEFSIFYSQVHDELVSRRKNMSDEDKRDLKSIYKAHNEIPDSPFVK